MTVPPREKRWFRRPGMAWGDEFAASSAVQAGDLLFMAGQGSEDREGRVLGQGDVRVQARQALANVRELVEEAGGTLDDVVDVVSLHRDARDIDAVLDVGRELFGNEGPAWTPAAFLGTHDPRVEVSVRAIAHLGAEQRQCFTSDALAWTRELPISGACLKGGLLFVSGQTALESDGTLSSRLDHVAQARCAYTALLDMVERAGGTVNDILDFASFHQDIRGAPATFEEVYIPEVLGSAVLEDASTTSHIGSPALQRPGVLGTYRCLADLGHGRRVGSLPDSIWWKGVLPISGAAMKDGGELVAVAGHVASDSDAELVAPGDVAGQVRYVFESMRESLAGLGASLDDVVEVTAFYKEPRAWRTVMEAGADYFSRERAPAWTLAAVPGLWVEGFLVEISALAVV
jgi:enamine deaminase RidA (YjgF/YER057c/UK114 family)